MNTISKPKMIWFDYGQTLVKEAPYDPMRGTDALLQHAVRNPHRYTAAEVQRVAAELRTEIGRGGPETRHLFQVEVPNHMFTACLYESLGIELALTPQEIDRIFWNAASPGQPTDGITEFLAFLKGHGIRTGVISNISYDSRIVKERIDTLLPTHEFEFILASSEYMFRKPHRRIFNLAVEKSGLSPSELWYIGDSYECDIRGAQAVGFTPIWYQGAITPPEKNDAAVRTISHWTELSTLLSSLLSQLLT